MNRIYGSRFNPQYQSGAIVVMLLGVLLATGLYLLVFYRLGRPYASVSGISGQVWVGRWVRGLHRFSSDAALGAAAIHAFRMYAQRRDWGPRALAWVSGVVLVFLILVCGWTGYVLVWDSHAQLLAIEGARLLDVLPIFSEPISRAFTGERGIPGGFFFLNLFAHVALPVGVGLLVWIHVSRVARPGILPPRRLSIAVVAGLLVLALVWPVGMAAEANLFTIPRDVPLDLFFAFWLPLARQVPAWVVWLVGGTITLLLLAVPLLSRPAPERRPAKSVVNERQCTGCEQCMHDCPYGAILMFDRTDGREGIVARVDPDLCVSCGICIGSCAPMALGPAERTGRDQLAAVRAWNALNMPGAHDVVMIGCDWSAGTAAFAADARVLHFPIACAGNIHTSTVEYLVRSGAGGVLIATCAERDCRGREGPKWLHQRLYEGREAELKERVDRARIRVVEASAGDARVLRDALHRFQADVAQLAAASAEDNVDLLALCDRVEEEVAS
jgi:ferredoxin/coenzyme F420-reducing hydrogenase delta subunit